MTKVTTDTQLGAALTPADAVPEILAATDEKYADPAYMAAMDATSASMAHQAGTAAAGWAGTSVEELVHDAGSHTDQDMRRGTFQGPAEVMTADGVATINSVLPVDQIPLASLRLDGGTQSRVEMSQDVIEEYATILRDGADLKPVVVFFDGIDFWLADGFHRYHAHVQVEAPEILGHIHTGTRRDAVLYSVGANGSHGLRRTKEDKRKAVETMLADPEWALWTQERIAKECVVSTGFVSKVVAAASLHGEEMRPTKKLVTRNGKTYEQDTAKIGRTRKAKDPATLVRPALDEPHVPTIATPHMTPEQGTVAFTRLDELLAENAALRKELDRIKPQLAAALDEVADLKAQLAEIMEHRDDIADALADTLAQNDVMTRVFESNDQVKASMIEVGRYRAVAEQANRTLAGRTQEFNERARNVRYWKNRAEKAEKQLAVAD